MDIEVIGIGMKETRGRRMVTAIGTATMSTDTRDHDETMTTRTRSTGLKGDEEDMGMTTWATVRITTITRRAMRKKTCPFQMKRSRDTKTPWRRPKRHSETHG